MSSVFLKNAKDYIRNYSYKIPRFGFTTTLVLTVTTLLYFVSIFNSNLLVNYSLNAKHLFQGETYRLSTYSFIHSGFFHFILNAFALVPLLSALEQENGSIQTIAIIMNGASIIGVVYSILSYLFAYNTNLLGSSGLVFFILSAYAIKQNEFSPEIEIYKNVKFALWLYPMVLLFVVAIFFPQSSFMGHFISILYGYSYGLGYSSKLNIPPFILSFVEDKLFYFTKHIKCFISFKDVKSTNSLDLPFFQQQQTENTFENEIPLNNFHGTGFRLGE